MRLRVVYTFRAGSGTSASRAVVFGAVGPRGRSAKAWRARGRPGSLRSRWSPARGFGALWALLAGVLKTRGGVSEIFAGLGLNFVAQGITLCSSSGPGRDPGVASMSGTRSPFLRSSGCPRFRGEGSRRSLCTAPWERSGSRRSSWPAPGSGSAFKAVAENPLAAILFGAQPSRYVLLAPWVLPELWPASPERSRSLRCTTG